VPSFFEIASRDRSARVTLEQAKARIGQLFQVGDEAAASAVSGRRVVIKQGLA